VKVAGLILAAGESRRMGSPKALLELEGETFLDRLTGLFAQFTRPVVVVLGCHAEVIRAGVRHPEWMEFIVNPDYSRGQLSSMQCGLRAIPEEAEGVLFTLVDHPSVRRSTIQALLSHPEAALAIPVCQGLRGHPIFFRRELIPEFLEPAVDSAKTVVRRHAARTCLVEVDDAGVLVDIDDLAAYRSLIGAAP